MYKIVHICVRVEIFITNCIDILQLSIDGKTLNAELLA